MRPFTLPIAVLVALGMYACKGEPSALAPEPNRALMKAPPTVTASPFEQRIALLKKTMPDHFHYAVEPPFVVVGDGSQERVSAHASGTIRWAVTHLKRDFFDKDPDALLEIYLFEGSESYAHYSTTLFDDPPDTPYGYYSPSDGALVMNISTGGGTLVHEIVHPFVEANFPDAPAWFNEGLGSLFEQSASRDGRIVGQTNWRLRGLQQQINNEALPSFRVLTHMSSADFYADEIADNYAQARYLLYYLQEEGLLSDYYRSFLANRETDPSGYQTLLRTLQRKPSEMPGFQRDWQSWVLTLRFGS